MKTKVISRLQRTNSRTPEKAKSRDSLHSSPDESGKEHSELFDCSSDELSVDDDQNNSSVSAFLKDGQLDLNKINKVFYQLQTASKDFSEKTKNLDIPVTLDHSKTPRRIYKQSRKTGKDDSRLSESENSYLLKHLKAICKKNGIDLDDFLILSRFQSTRHLLNNEARTKLLLYLANKLSDRGLSAIYRFLLRVTAKNGIFSPEEDEVIKTVYENYTGKNTWTVLGVLLNRSKLNITRRYLRLQSANAIGKRPKIKKGKLPKSSDLLISTLLRASRIDRSCPSWKNIGRLMQTHWTGIGNENYVSGALAKAMFYCDLFPRVKCAKSIPYYKTCIDIILKLSKEKELSWESFSWRKISDEFNGVGAFFLYGLFRKMVEENCTPEQWGNLSACVYQLQEQVVPDFKLKADEEELYLVKILIS